MKPDQETPKNILQRRDPLQPRMELVLPRKKFFAEKREPSTKNGHPLVSYEILLPRKEKK